MGEQVDLGLISWSMLLAIEGRRRNISSLWSYQLLAQLASLPFAQNLFFVAILSTPKPLPETGASVSASRCVSLPRNSRDSSVYCLTHGRGEP